MARLTFIKLVFSTVWRKCVKIDPKVNVKKMKIKTSLLRRLQPQTLSDATPPIGQINRFSKMDVTFEPPMGF